MGEEVILPAPSRGPVALALAAVGMGAAGLAILGAFQGARSRGPTKTKPAAASSGSSASAPSSSSSGSGWSSAAGVKLSSDARAFLDAVAGRVGFPLYVTSGERSAAEQARAMLKKVELGEDLADLLALYRRDDLVEELYKLPLEQAAWEKAIQAQMDRGDFLSSHQRKGALDLRTKDKTAAQVDAMQAACEAEGARVVVEATPPHMHLELP